MTNAAAPAENLLDFENRESLEVLVLHALSYILQVGINTSSI